jgi:hypothetical protein
MPKEAMKKELYLTFTCRWKNNDIKKNLQPVITAAGLKKIKK